MYQRLAQLEKLVENDNSSSRRPRHDIFFSAWMTGSARRIPSDTFRLVKELLCGALSGRPQALPVNQGEKIS